MLSEYLNDRIMKGLSKSELLQSSSPLIISTIRRIADALVYELKHEVLAEGVHVERLYASQIDDRLEDTMHGQLQVFVVPRQEEYLPLDRTSNKYHGTIDIVFSQELNRNVMRQMDTLLTVIECVTDRFRLKRLDTYHLARCIKVIHSVGEYSSMGFHDDKFVSELTMIFEQAR